MNITYDTEHFNAIHVDFRGPFDDQMLSDTLPMNPIKVQFQDFLGSQEFALNFEVTFDGLSIGVGQFTFPMAVYLQKVSFPFSLVSPVHHVDASSISQREHHQIFFKSQYIGTDILPEIDIDKIFLHQSEIQLVFDINPSESLAEVINENLANIARAKGVSLEDVEWQINIQDLSFIRHQSDFNTQPCLHPLSDYQIY